MPLVSWYHVVPGRMSHQQEFKKCHREPNRRHKFFVKTDRQASRWSMEGILWTSRAAQLLLSSSVGAAMQLLTSASHHHLKCPCMFAGGTHSCLSNSPLLPAVSFGKTTKFATQRPTILKNMWRVSVFRTFLCLTTRGDVALLAGKLSPVLARPLGDTCCTNVRRDSPLPPQTETHTVRTLKTKFQPSCITQ